MTGRRASRSAARYGNRGDRCQMDAVRAPPLDGRPTRVPRPREPSASCPSRAATATTWAWASRHCPKRLRKRCGSCRERLQSRSPPRIRQPPPQRRPLRPSGRIPAARPGDLLPRRSCPPSRKRMRARSPPPRRLSARNPQADRSHADRRPRPPRAGSSAASRACGHPSANRAADGRAAP